MPSAVQIKLIQNAAFIEDNLSNPRKSKSWNAWNILRNVINYIFAIKKNIVSSERVDCLRNQAVRVVYAIILSLVCVL